MTARAATAGALTVSAVDRNAVDNRAVATAIAGATGPAVAIGVVTIGATLDATVEALVTGAPLTATAGGMTIAADRIADARGGHRRRGRPDRRRRRRRERAQPGRRAVTALVTGSTTGMGAIAVTADARSRSLARSDGGAGLALLAIGAATATAENTAATTAGFADGSNGSTASTTASTGLTVRATRAGLTDGAATTEATTVLGAVGAVAQGTVVATATDSGAVRARIGDGHRVDARTGDVAVTGTLHPAHPGGGQRQRGRRGRHHGVRRGRDRLRRHHRRGRHRHPDRRVADRAGHRSAVTADAWTLGVALIGAAGGKAAAESTGSVTASIGPAAGPAYGTVETAGAVAVLAQLAQAAAVDTRGGAAGISLAGVGGLAARAVVAGSGTAFVGAGQKVRAGSLSVAVTAGRRGAGRAHRVGDVRGRRGGPGRRAGSSSTALVTGSLDASVRDGATLTLTGAVAIGAAGTATAAADARGGTGGALDGQRLPRGRPDRRRRRRAPRRHPREPGRGRDVVPTAGSLRVVADATDTATARLQKRRRAGRRRRRDTAVVDADVAARVAGRTSGSAGKLTASGAVDVLATGTRSTDATGRPAAGGLITAAWLKGTARTTGTVAAWLADGTDIASAAGLVAAPRSRARARPLVGGHRRGRQGDRQRAPFDRHQRRAVLRLDR
ncbi:MAG: hypothetical protein U0R72_02420 [Nakamurella multipartita]